MKRPVPNLEALRAVAKELLQKYPQGAVVSLKGDLGAGKTTFVRELLTGLYESKGLAIPRVVSPSYVLHQRYAKADPIIHHFDLYRLENVSTEQLIELGIFESINEARERQGFVFIEWAEKVTAPKEELAFDCEISFEISSDGKRFVTL